MQDGIFGRVSTLLLQCMKCHLFSSLFFIILDFILFFNVIQNIVLLYNFNNKFNKFKKLYSRHLIIINNE